MTYSKNALRAAYLLALQGEYHAAAFKLKRSLIPQADLADIEGLLNSIIRLKRKRQSRRGLNGLFTGFQIFLLEGRLIEAFEERISGLDD